MNKNKDKNNGRSIVRMWKNIFNYTGTSESNEYIIPVVLYMVLIVIEFIIQYLMSSVLDETVFTVLRVIAVVLLVYLAVAFLPMLSLSVRRLRAAGKSRWWTILVLFIGIGFIVIGCICMPTVNADVEYIPENNYNMEIYGPPEMFEMEEPYENEYSVPDDVETEQLDIVDTSDDYDPMLNMEPCIYGPPEMFE